jgi:diguanylate cyclase (GGDEF)-like protein/PAS domain S-box-containing protein
MAHSEDLRMENRRSSNGSTSHVGADNVSASAEGQLAQISSLIQDFDRPEPPPPIPAEASVADRLVEARLGIATSLFTALRWKHEPTAQHCLRVALNCSGWADFLSLPEDLHADLELAALLHDVGKIGVLDAILCKPGTLNPQEASIMDCHWLMGEQILRGSCASENVLETIRYVRGWFDGTRGQCDKRGDELPLASRMLAVVDAFDSMTTDHVYRRAMSAQRALDELYRCAGTQFDPDLVVVFSKMFEQDPLAMQQRAAQRWLSALCPDSVNGVWRRSEAPAPVGPASTESLFQQKLLDNMQDAVIFIDASRKVVYWNLGAERMTGISGKSMRQRLFVPASLQLHDENQKTIDEAHCPIATALASGVQWFRRLNVMGREGRLIAVDAQAAPVVDAAGVVVGLTLLLHDVSSEISLEERCNSLHDKATKDPLTQAANRAEFDRVSAEFVKAHRETKRPCSLIMTDIDRFKSVNDTYGHQAGDQVIQAIAQMLKNFSRSGDLVARYGGEEFALLCADCDNATAAQRADEVRVAFSMMRHSALGNRCVTASFGVTEIQPGDTSETLLRRADRALMNAKESGRNRVVQLGVGGDAGDDDHGKPAAASKKRLAGNTLLKREMTSDSPVERNIEKLKGFVADHHAEITLTDRNRVQLQLDGERGGPIFRRGSDRSIRLFMDISLHEEAHAPDNNPRAIFKRTRIGVTITPVKSRERRTADALDRARQLVVSLRSYLMATDVDGVEAVTEEDGGLWQSFMGLFGVKSGQPAEV